MTGVTPLRQQQRWLTQDAPEHVGDCWRTCIANLLRVERDSVPHFVELGVSDRVEGHWWELTDAFLAGYGLEMAPDSAWNFVGQDTAGSGWVIANGLTSRSFAHYDSEEPWALHYRALLARYGDRLPIKHSVLWDTRTGEVIDPHPSGEGLTFLEDVTVVIPR